MALQSVFRSCGRALVFTDRFFADSAPQPGYGGVPVGIVAVLHVIGYYATLVAGAVIASLTHGQYTVIENIADLGWEMLGPGILVGVVVVVNWLVASGILHAALRVRGGDGTFGETLSVVGWSSPVTLVVLLLWGGGFLLTVAASPLVMSYDARVVTAAAGAKFAGIAGSVITLLLQGHIWSKGLQHRHGVGRREAAQATALTIVLGFVAIAAAA